jgi:hypothetical protein
MSFVALSAPALEQLLRSARQYVAGFEPRSAEEAGEQEQLLHDIDDALPALEPAAPPITYCDIGGTDMCSLPKGHAGPCDDIPF